MQITLSLIVVTMSISSAISIVMLAGLINSNWQLLAINILNKLLVFYYLTRNGKSVLFLAINIEGDFEPLLSISKSNGHTDADWVPVGVFYHQQCRQQTYSDNRRAAN
jgi:hypothetical protein